MLSITDRTSFNAHVNKPSTPLQTPNKHAEIIKSNAEVYNDLAAKIRAKKAAYSLKILKKPEQPKIETIQEVAERIKQNRFKLKENHPLPVQKELKITYKNDQGVECQAIPTNHCIDQFAKRIRIIKPHLFFNNQEEILFSLAEHFNKTFKDGGKDYQKRNRTRQDPESPFVLHGRWYAFIVKPSGYILTFELTGKFRAFNKIHTSKKEVDSES